MNRDLVEKLKAKTSTPTLQRDPNEFTCHEFAQEFGLQRTAARERLRKLVETGVVVSVPVPYINAAGILTKTQGYRYVGDEHADRGRTEGA